jgi:hypothetical protein
LKDKESFLLEYGRRSAEAFRQCKEDLFTVQNSRKARIGGLEGLRDPSFMRRKATAEAELRAKAQRAGSEHGDDRAAAWDKIAKAQQVAAGINKPYFYHEGPGSHDFAYAFDSELFAIARKLVRLADEKTRPNSERLEEYRESGLKSLELKVFSEAPIYPEYEKAKLAHSLARWKQVLPDEPLVERVLHGRSPAEAAKQLVEGSKLADVSIRRKLADGGTAAILGSGDPMIKLALVVDADSRAVRKVHEDQVEGVERANYALIAKALFDEKGAAVYPDATFTLRLAFGTVKGYEAGGREIPAYTTIGGAFAHAKAHGDKPPYELPKSWLIARDGGKLNLDTPFNFVSTADIIGGNSGSPVVNRDNEIVGLIFDGNIQSLVLDFGYDDRAARAVSVDSRAIIEALRSIYQADRLADELTRR